jgi:prepilin-type processing-associated H-X9-DG protein
LSDPLIWTVRAVHFSPDSAGVDIRHGGVHGGRSSVVFVDLHISTIVSALASGECGQLLLGQHDLQVDVTAPATLHPLAPIRPEVLSIVKTFKNNKWKNNDLQMEN